jgi:hypothetical protein
MCEHTHVVCRASASSIATGLDDEQSQSVSHATGTSTITTPGGRGGGGDSAHADVLAAEEKLVIFVLNHTHHPATNAGAAAHDVVDRDKQVLDDFWGSGLADEEEDHVTLAKLAEVLDVDPSRLRIQWSRVSDPPNVNAPYTGHTAPYGADGGWVGEGGGEGGGGGKEGGAKGRGGGRGDSDGSEGGPPTSGAGSGGGSGPTSGGGSTGGETEEEDGVSTRRQE